MADPCPRCKAIDSAVPVEAQLRSLLVDDFDIENERFIPRAQTPEQAAAGAAYAHALSLFIAAYGLELTGARLGRTLDVLRLFAKSSRIEGRRREARERLARARYDAGEVGPDQAADFVARGFTPDYPGKDRDDAWMAENIAEDAGA